MNDSFSIGKIAKLFHVPPSKLRYWDDAGLLRFDRAPGSNYRVPSFQTMMDLCEVIFCRSISIPTQEIKALSAMDEAQMAALLEKNKERLEQEAKALRAASEKIEDKLRLLQKVRELKGKPLVLCHKKLPALRSFSFEDEWAVEMYVHDSHKAAVRITTDGPTQFCVFLEKEAPPVLRPRDTSPQTYLYGLLRVATGDPEDNNGSVFFARAKEMGYRPRDLMGRYLMTICEDKRYEYYEGFLALEAEG